MRAGITLWRLQRFDPDNLVAAVKPILDAMRRIGYLKNDNETWLHLSPMKQCQAGSLRQTTIEIHTNEMSPVLLGLLLLFRTVGAEPAANPRHQTDH